MACFLDQLLEFGARNGDLEESALGEHDLRRVFGGAKPGNDVAIRYSPLAYNLKTTF